MQISASHPEGGPSDLCAPRGGVGRVPRSDQVGLPDRPGHRKRVGHQPGDHLAAGHVDVVVRADVGGDGQLDGRERHRVHPSAVLGLPRRSIHQRVPPADLEQRVVVQATGSTRRLLDGSVQLGHRTGVPRKDIVMLDLGLDRRHRDRLDGAQLHLHRRD